MYSAAPHSWITHTHTDFLILTAASREGWGDWEETGDPSGKTERVPSSTMFERR